MIVISDSNIIFSALYSERSLITSILQNERNLQFIAPTFVLEEIKEHLQEIMADLGKTQREVLEQLRKILVNIKFYEINTEIPQKTRIKAIDLAKDIDLDDAPFVALHLHTGHRIWTGDKILRDGLLAKGYDICISTSELKNYLYKKK